MRLLLTGSTGFVGKNVLQYFAKNTDWEITKTDFDVASIIPQTQHRYDFILNMASISSVEQSLHEPADVIKNNTMLTINMLEFARQNPPELFIQFSTVEAENITNPYAASKRAQEVIAESYARSYGLGVVVVRSTNIIGHGQRSEKFVPKLIEQIKAGEKVSIYATDGKPGVRYYNPVKNVADALLYIMRNYGRFADKGYSEIGITGGQSLNNLRMARTIAKLLGKKLQYEIVEAEAVRPGYLQAYKPKNGLTGWQPVQTLEEGLKEVL